MVSKAGNQAINLLPVPVWFPKQAINQSTCYWYLFSFQGRQSSNQLATSTCLVSKAGNQAINLFGFQSRQSNNQLATGTCLVSK
jgi:hypothetical protein